MFDTELKPRVLMGPGPSNVHPRVLRAISFPLVGHLDPQFLSLMDAMQNLLRYVFQTENELTFPVSGTGSAAMEASIANFIERGDDALICINGYFGQRMAEMANRYGANVRTIEKPWGEIFTKDEIANELKKRPAKIVCIVHAETSTGTLQPMEGMGDLVHQYGGLLIMDCVTSLGGLPVLVDDWCVDVAYSGTQKCLSAPPGLGPMTISSRAQEAMHTRNDKVPNWYLDVNMVEEYWGKERTYHHTAPINMNYALFEALRLIKEESIEKRWDRHRKNAELLCNGLRKLGLDLFVSEQYRLPTLTTVCVPEDIDDLNVRERLLNEYNVEIAGGIGDLYGKIWRIGCMGHSSRRENVMLLLSALDKILS